MAFKHGKNIRPLRPRGSKSTAVVAKTALRKVVKIERSVEKKFHTITATLTPHDQNDVGLFPTDIAQGNTQATRTGDKISPTSLYLTGYLLMDVGQTGSSETDILIVQDRQQISDTGPEYSDVFDGNPGGGILVNNNTLGRFKILSHKQYSLTPGVKESIRIKTYMKLSGSTRYNGLTSTDLQKNGIYMIMRSNKSLINFPPVFTCSLRMHFTDL